MLSLAAFGAAAEKGRKHAAETKHSVYSLAADVKTRIKFINGSSQVRKIYWMNYDGKRKLYNTLKGGDSYTQETFLTHPWLITDKDGNALALYYPDSEPRTVWLR